MTKVKVIIEEEVVARVHNEVIIELPESDLKDIGIILNQSELRSNNTLGIVSELNDLGYGVLDITSNGYETVRLEGTKIIGHEILEKEKRE